MFLIEVVENIKGNFISEINSNFSKIYGEISVYFREAFYLNFSR